MNDTRNGTFFRAGFFFGLGLLTVYVIVAIVVGIIYAAASGS